jgi:hypothetical protein
VPAAGLSAFDEERVMSAMQRPHKICDSDRVECPRCGGVIRRIRPVLGSLLAYCDNKQLGGKSCGQHVHVLGAPEGICIVAPLSKQEFETACKNGVRAAELYCERA